jgi:hypothetical protein
LQNLFGVAEICAALFVAQFFIFVLELLWTCDIYINWNFSSFTWIKIYKKFVTCWGAIFFGKTAVVFIGRLCLLLFWAFIWVLRWFLLSLLIFSECWQLNKIYGHLERNFIWCFLCRTYVMFVPFNVSHSRKEVGNSFVVKFFLQGRNNHRARIHLSNGEHQNLGYAPW